MPQEVLNYKNIVWERKLVSPGIASFLFGNTPKQHRRALAYYNLINTARSVCLFYANLIQACVFHDALKNGTTFDDDSPDAIHKAIRAYWVNHNGKDLGVEKSVFSFLKDCIKSVQYNGIFGENAAKRLNEQCEYYERYVAGNSRMYSDIEKYENSFRSLLLELPLLRQCDLDIDKQRFQFPDGDTAAFAPFLFYWDNVSQTVSERPTDDRDVDRYVLTSVTQGDSNNEVTLCLICLGQYKSIRRELTIKGNDNGLGETMIALCKTVGVNTIQWYPPEAYWCDFAFVERIVCASTKVVLTYIKSREDTYSDADKTSLMNELADLFKCTGLESKIKDAHIEVRTEEDLKRFWYAFMIQNGVFKVILGLLYDDPSSIFELPDESKSSESGRTSDTTGYGDKLFDLFVTYFRENCTDGTLTNEAIDQYVKICKENVDQHQKRLDGIYLKHGSCYEIRKREIAAENRAYAIMKMVGYAEAALFPDKEELLSIDDYFNKCSNPMDEVVKDLRKVLILLSEIYGGLLRNRYPFDEARFIRDAEEIYREIRLFSIEQLFDYFEKDVCGAAERIQGPVGENLLWKLTGRTKVMQKNLLSKFRQLILTRLHDSKENGRIFISYSHEDKEIVRRFYDTLIELNIKPNNVFYDDSDVHISEAWITKVQDAMPTCCTSILFLSKNALLSKAVSSEYTLAEDQAKSNQVSNADYFIYVYLANETKEYKDYNDLYRKTAARASAAERKYIEAFDATNGEAIGYFDEHIYDKDSGLYAEIRKRLGKKDERKFQNAVKAFYMTLKDTTETHLTRLLLDNSNNKFPIFNPDEMTSKCVFPMLVSVRETKIKRDNTTILGYEMIRSDRTPNAELHHILSSRKLAADDYYCIPNQNTSADDCSWIVDPVMIPASVLEKINKEDS